MCIQDVIQFRECTYSTGSAHLHVHVRRRNVKLSYTNTVSTPPEIQPSVLKFKFSLFFGHNLSTFSVRILILYMLPKVKIIIVKIYTGTQIQVCI